MFHLSSSGCSRLGLLSPLVATSTEAKDEARPPSFPSVLHADGRAPEFAGEFKLYGQFVGDWTMEVGGYTPDGAPHHGQGEIHFGWVLGPARCAGCLDDSET